MDTIEPSILIADESLNIINEAVEHSNVIPEIPETILIPEPEEPIVITKPKRKMNPNSLNALSLATHNSVISRKNKKLELKKQIEKEEEDDKWFQLEVQKLQQRDNLEKYINNKIKEQMDNYTTQLTQVKELYLLQKSNQQKDEQLDEYTKKYDILLQKYKELMKTKTYNIV